jgi:hypothetical protein
MTTERDLDRTLDRWMDDGPTIVADRVIAAAMTDVHTTRQRGARWVPLKELFMTMKPAATLVAIAAVAVLGVAAYRFVLGGDIGLGGPPDRVLTTGDLPRIILTEENAPDGLTVDATDDGAPALVTPLRAGGPVLDQSAFVDALITNLNSTATGGYVSYAALFETDADAEVAFDYLVAEHTDAGWGMQRSTVDPGLGDESATFTGAAYDIFERNEVHLWRVDNLVLAAVGVGDFDADQVRSIAELMDDRAQ